MAPSCGRGDGEVPIRVDPGPDRCTPRRSLSSAGTGRIFATTERPRT